MRARLRKQYRVAFARELGVAPAALEDVVPAVAAGGGGRPT